MIIRKYPILSDQLPFDEALFPKSALFFDIETTGLSHRTSHLCMIGAICREDGQIMLIQWFLRKPSEERELLLQFSGLLKKSRTVIHYNGQTFDIPYLQERCRYWNVPDPFGNENDVQSLDLYREMRPMKKMFRMSSLKQKDVEKQLLFARTDRLSGKDLIRVYHDYLNTAGDKELELILLHNHDDLTGMLTIYGFYTFLASLRKPIGAPAAEIRENTLQLTLQTPLCTPVPLHIQADGLDLMICENQITLTVTGIYGCFRHYYSNYSDYYYLPLEDTAIHKSVGIYVDPSCRRKAKADTCYTKKEGLFFFQPSPVFLPDFRENARKGPSYFSSEQPEKDPAALNRYAAELIAFLFDSL